MKNNEGIISLPCEILMKIFEHLSHKDLAHSSLVCQRWRTIGEDPIFWKNFKLLVNDENIEHFHEIIMMRRLSNVPSIMFENIVLEDGHLQALKKTRIVNVRMSRSDTFDLDCDSTRISANIFAEVINNLETFDFYNWDIQLTEPQLTQLFMKMREGTRLKKLEVLNDQNLHKIPQNTLAVGLNKIRSLTLMCQDIHEESQFSFEHFFSHMKIESNVEELDISYNNLSYIAPDLLSTALNKVEKINLFHTELTEAQLESLLTRMSKGTAVKNLDIESHTTLQDIQPQLLASVVNNLESVNLGFTSLGQQHIEILFQLMKTKTNLKSLNIRGERNVCSIDPSLFAEALNKVKTVNLTRCHLDKQHLKLLFEKIVDNTNIEELQLAENDLSEIPAKQLSECVRCLKIVNFSKTSLLKNQIIRILRDIKNSNTAILTKNLDLRNKFESLPEELIKCVRNRIEILNV